MELNSQIHELNQDISSNDDLKNRLQAMLKIKDGKIEWIKERVREIAQVQREQVAEELTKLLDIINF